MSTPPPHHHHHHHHHQQQLQAPKPFPRPFHQRPSHIPNLSLTHQRTSQIPNLSSPVTIIHPKPFPGPPATIIHPGIDPKAFPNPPATIADPKLSLTNQWRLQTLKPFPASDFYWHEGCKSGSMTKSKIINKSSESMIKSFETCFN